MLSHGRRPPDCRGCIVVEDFFFTPAGGRPMRGAPGDSPGLIRTLLSPSVLLPPLVANMWQSRPTAQEMTVSI